jgi:dTDP-4-dehydrorhamnose reductase
MSGEIFITGGSGLLALNWAMVKRDFNSIILGTHRRDVLLAGVETRPLQLESVDRILHLLEKVKPQVVIHTAGLTNVDECEVKPDLARHINVELAENVALACSRLSVPFVHISTDHLFSGGQPLVNENHTPSPKNVYARTKAEAEYRVLEAHNNSLVIRTNFYGWGPAYRKSFSDAVIGSLRSGQTITLFSDVFYTPILIEALVNAVHDLIERKVSGIYNVVGDDRVSKYEFGHKIAEKFNLDSSLIREGQLSDLNSAIQRPKDMSLSNCKISNLLGRKLGGVDEHIARLYQQEQDGLAKEIRDI